MKIATFPTSALFDAIKSFVPKTEIDSTVLDIAYEVDDKIYFARVVNDSSCDDTSTQAFGLTTFDNRSSEQGVYLSPRRNSIFGGQLVDAVQLMKDGYKVYPIEEYTHSDIALRLVSKKAIRTHLEILNGTFRDGHSKQCQFASTFAFLAQPKSWSAPTAEFLNEFSNWINGYSFSYELMCATPCGTNEDGETKFTVEVIDDGNGYYSSDNAESAGLDALDHAIPKHETVTI